MNQTGVVDAQETGTEADEICLVPDGDELRIRLKAKFAAMPALPTNQKPVSRGKEPA